MANLEIISTQTTVLAEKIINGNKANFTWNYQNGSIPGSVNFNAMRGVPGDENHTGNSTISGVFYPDNGKFDVQNHNFMDGDFELYDQILSTCRDIVVGITEPAQ